MLESLKQLRPWQKAVFVFIVLVTGYAGWEQIKTGNVLPASQQESQQNLQSINITVQDRQTLQPVENVSARIVFDGPPVQKMSDRNGYFEIQIPPRKSATVTLTKDGFITAQETINLETDPSTTRVLYMDAQN
ncbi:hypothetical protein [Spirulina major]|uniref:hypothetical protein n=1 Tax=Spirulina major TaxID=270636 RepID=UPI000935406E|nr:hypothetical protein [Spirulina major]